MYSAAESSDIRRRKAAALTVTYRALQASKNKVIEVAALAAAAVSDVPRLLTPGPERTGKTAVHVPCHTSPVLYLVSSLHVLHPSLTGTITGFYDTDTQYTEHIQLESVAIRKPRDSRTRLCGYVYFCSDVHSLLLLTANPIHRLCQV